MTEVILHTQANISRLGLCLGAGTLSQAKIFRLECSVQVAPNSKRSHCTLASQYLASQHLYRLDLIDVGSAAK